MTARAATVRLYVALVAVLTAVLALVVDVVRLVVMVVTAATALIEARAPARARRDAPAARDMTSRPASGFRLVQARSNAPTTPTEPVAPTGAHQLTTCLVGLGFSLKEVAPVVASLGARVDRESLQVLIPVVLRALAPAALGG